MKMIYEAKEELEKGIRVEPADYPKDISQYDIIFLGSPNWWNDLPMPIVTFLEHLNWQNKTLVPFITSEGSGFGNTVNHIKAICREANVLDGLSITGSQAVNFEREVSEFVKKVLSNV